MVASIDKFKSLLSQKGGLARSNLFRVVLPPLAGVSSREMDVLCTNVNLPGRQIMTQERLIGIKGQKMPTGFVQDDVSMTFIVLNDYGVKKYFEAWQQLTVNQDTYEISYLSTYAKDIRIDQLKKGYTFELAGIDKLLSNLTGLNVDVDLTVESYAYSCVLYDAFPTSLNAIELTNDLDGYVQLNVQLSYRNWKAL